MRSIQLGTLAVVLIGMAGAVQAQTSGFYVRGDAGFAKPRDANLKNDPDNATGTGVLLNPGAALNDLDRSPVFGLGVGYRVSPMFRADLTFSLRNGLDLSDGEGTTASTNGRNDVSAKVKSRAAMLTGYADLGGLLPANYGWVNPYLGAGLGYASNEVSDLRSRVDTGAGGVFNSTSTSSGTSRGLAWQLAAGLGFEVSRSLTLDVGYRYVDLGSLKVSAGKYTYTGVAGTVSVNALKGDLSTHELTVGLRYSF